MHILTYNFVAKWQKGKDNDAVDALSHHPCSQPVPTEDLAKFDLDIQGSLSLVRCLQLDYAQSLHGDSLRLKEVCGQPVVIVNTRISCGLLSLDFLITKLTSEAIRGHFSVNHNLLVDGCRLFIPTMFCSTVLERLHETHQGVTRSKDRAQLTVYWGPGLIRPSCPTLQTASCARTLSHLTITKPHRWPWILLTTEVSTSS